MEKLRIDHKEGYLKLKDGRAKEIYCRVKKIIPKKELSVMNPYNRYSTTDGLVEDNLGIPWNEVVLKLFQEFGSKVQIRDTWDLVFNINGEDYYRTLPKAETFDFTLLNLKEGDNVKLTTEYHNEYGGEYVSMKIEKVEG